MSVATGKRSATETRRDVEKSPKTARFETTETWFSKRGERFGRARAAVSFLLLGHQKPELQSRRLASGSSQSSLSWIVFPRWLEKARVPLSVVSKVFCASRSGKDVASERGIPILSPSHSEVLLGIPLNRCVADRNSPHASMQIAGFLADSAKDFAGSVGAECARSVSGVCYESVLDSSGNLAPNMEDWMLALEGSEGTDSVLVTAFRTLYTLLILNRRGIRHNDPHLGNVLMGLIGEQTERPLSRTFAYFPDHAGAILLASARTDADVDRWLQTCPSTGFERLPHAPPEWVVSILRRTLNLVLRVRREQPDTTPDRAVRIATRWHEALLTRESASSRPGYGEFARAEASAAAKLARLGAFGCPWFLVRDAEGEPWPFLVDWDWGANPVEGVGAENAFLNDNPSGWLPGVNNASTLDPKGDAFVFAASAKETCDAHPDVRVLDSLRNLLGEIAPTVDVANGESRERQDVLTKSSAPADATSFTVADAWFRGGAQANRFCPGPVEFAGEGGTCAATVGRSPCSAAPDVYGKWTPPDCAFRSTEDLFLRSTTLQGRPGGALERRWVRADRPFEGVVQTVDAVFGDWMRFRPDDVASLCRVAGLQNLDRFDPSFEPDPLFAV